MIGILEDGDIEGVKVTGLGEGSTNRRLEELILEPGRVVGK